MQICPTTVTGMSHYILFQWRYISFHQLMTWTSEASWSYSKSLMNMHMRKKLMFASFCCKASEILADGQL